MRSFDDDVLKDRGSGPPHRAALEDSHKDRTDVSGPAAPVDTRRVLALQRSAGNAAVAQLLSEDEEGASVRDVVGKGGGRPLPAASKMQMEQSFGQDFSDVRLHSGGDAASSARSVQAKAYTVGNDIVLGDGSPSLESSEGQRTLAHELTHVVQQRSGPVDGTPAEGGLSVSDPSDRFEQQAERAADNVSAGQLADGQSAPAPAAAGVSVQRQEEEDDEEESSEG
ncbi:MAG TPA: DUF4157 domain-containing protein, partial [Acidimicrobiales bacterium]|nr:DUF4157 domain-containing protein [Acidimicrobiales bacterium]